MVGVDAFPIEIVPFRGRSLVFGGVHQFTVSVAYRHFKAQLEYDRTGPIQTQGSTCHMRHGLPSPRCKMAVSKNKGTPKWMGKIMENPNKWMILGVPLFLETPKSKESMLDCVLFARDKWLRPGVCFFVSPSRFPFWPSDFDTPFWRIMFTSQISSNI